MLIISKLTSKGLKFECIGLNEISVLNCWHYKN